MHFLHVACWKHLISLAFILSGHCWSVSFSYPVLALSFYADSSVGRSTSSVNSGNSSWFRVGRRVELEARCTPYRLVSLHSIVSEFSSRVYYVPGGVRFPPVKNRPGQRCHSHSSKSWWHHDPGVTCRLLGFHVQIFVLWWVLVCACAARGHVSLQIRDQCSGFLLARSWLSLQCWSLLCCADVQYFVCFNVRSFRKALSYTIV